MKLYSAHLKADAEPVLVREGFAWGALIFGPLWLAVHRAWIAAGVAALPRSCSSSCWRPSRSRRSCRSAWLVMLGLFGHDLRAQALEHRGYSLVHVSPPATRTRAGCG